MLFLMLLSKFNQFYYVFLIKVIHSIFIHKLYQDLMPIYSMILIYYTDDFLLNNPFEILIFITFIIFLMLILIDSYEFTTLKVNILFIFVGII